MEIIPLPLGMVNAYLVKTPKGVFLIDTGLSFQRKKLEEIIQQQGVNLHDIKMVIITHGDLDHVGNCAYLQKKYGLKMALHEDEAEQCRSGKTNFDRKRKASFLGKMIQSVLYTLIFKPMMKNNPVEGFEPDFLLSDGQDLASLGFDARVIHTPGHTKGSIGILTKTRQFFSGDTINNRKKPQSAEIIENEEALVSSLEKIKDLDIEMVYPGHGKPFCIQDHNLFN